MRTNYVLCILFLVFSGQAWAQLTCTHCKVDPGAANGVDPPVRTTETTPIEILNAPGTFSGTIVLTGHSQFSITDRGHYTLIGAISSEGTTSLSLSAPQAGDWGGRYAGVVFEGETANTYSGPTTINGGFIACNKSAGTVAIPGDIILKPTVKEAEAGLWFGANHQLSGSGVLIFNTDREDTNTAVSLNGTTQSVLGIKGATHTEDLIHNIVPGNPTSISGINPNTTNTKATLILTGSGERYDLGGKAELKGGDSGELEVQVKGTSQMIFNPKFIKRIIFSTEENASLELHEWSGSADTLENATFKGNGLIKKTGWGALTISNGAFLKSGGTLWVSQGTLRNQGTTLYSKDSEINQAVLKVDIPDGGNSNPAFDMNGSASVFAGLTGGGWVQNNWRGYSDLTLNTEVEKIFTGVIRDNPANAQVSSQGTGTGVGGINIRKEGAGTQVLTGANLYTGSTTIVRGTLKLQGGAKLGGGTYGGVLEISNAENDPQATFEHNGNETQIFNGNINGTGSNTAQPSPGIFLQSGSGKSIINGNNNFFGSVNVTNGFLGGSGNLRHSKSVTVGERGSIGGGDGDGANDKGDTLIVSSLTFTAATSQLIVTPMPNKFPGPVYVKSVDNIAGKVTAARGFTVAVMGNYLQSGYILVCSNGADLPLPVLRNITGKNVRLKWDNIGLWMQVNVGEIKLRVNSVCPKGKSPGNSRITIDAIYSDASDLPPAETTRDYFTLSENRVRSSNIETRKNGNTITATFDGANPTEADMQYTITYDDRKNEVMRTVTKMSRQPTVSLSSGGNPMYLGMSLVLQAAGNAGTIISAENTNIARVGPTTETLSATATTLAVGHVKFLAVDADGCQSEYLSVEVKATPPGGLPPDPATGDPNPSMAFSVFPIPAEDQLTIVNHEGDLQHLTIRDIHGKVVANEAVNGNEVKLSVAHLVSGIYLLTVRGYKGVKHLKISKR